MTKHRIISQREARALKAKVKALEYAEDQRRNAWSSSWPEGVIIAADNITDRTNGAIKTARKLGHAVVATLSDGGQLMLHALPLSKEKSA